jgi:hypothetical protein
VERTELLISPVRRDAGRTRHPRSRVARTASHPFRRTRCSLLAQVPSSSLLKTIIVQLKV